MVLVVGAVSGVFLVGGDVCVVCGVCFGCCFGVGGVSVASWLWGGAANFDLIADSTPTHRSWMAWFISSLNF